MSNLYEILEVSQNASKEIIEKAYRVLAKKYHPDLQKTEEDRKIAEVKMKQINEAYDILSDDEKRKEYDEELKKEIERQKRIDKQEQINILKQQAQSAEQNQKNNNAQNLEQNNNYNNQVQKTNEQEYIDKQHYENIKTIQNELNKAYRQAYNDYWKERGYKVKEPWTWKRFLNLVKVIAIIFIIIIIIWLFPPTHNVLVNFYEGDAIVKTVVNIIGQIFVGIGNGFISIFRNGI